MIECVSPRRLLLLTACLALAVLTAACSGSSTSRKEAEAVVTEFLERWQDASGPPRDEAAASAMRRLLADGLADRARGVAVGNAIADGGRRLDLLYNELMGLAVPQDEGFEVVGIDPGEDGALEVTVRLLYSEGAAGAAAASGVIPFERVTEVHEQVADDPVRVLTLRQVGADWRIVAIDRS